MSGCLAAASAGVDEFQLVATVPSGDPLRDRHHPLRRIVGELIAPTRDRYERLLVRSSKPAMPRVFDTSRYRATRGLSGEAVLLIDDMWTSGASAESAAGALSAAGAGVVAMIAVARHINRGWQDNAERLERVARVAFDPLSCAICATGSCLTTKPAAALTGDGGLSDN